MKSTSNKIKGTEPKTDIPWEDDLDIGGRGTKLGVEDTDAKDRKDEGCQKPEAPTTKDWLSNGEAPYGNGVPGNTGTPSDRRNNTTSSNETHNSKREEPMKVQRHIRRAMILIAISILANSTKKNQSLQQRKPENNKTMVASPTHTQGKHDEVDPCIVALAPNPSPHTYLRLDPKPVPNGTATLEI